MLSEKRLVSLRRYRETHVKEEKERGKRYYDAHREKIKVVIKKKQIRFSMKCVEYKGDRCSDCRYVGCSCTFAFHHTNPETKKFLISQMVCKPWEEVMKEMDKTVLLCHNCHAKRHHKCKS